MFQYTNGKHPNLASSGVIEHTVALTPATVTTGGAVASIANPLGVTLIIIDAFVRTTVASTGASTLDIGIAANGTTSNDTLFDGLGVNGTPGMFDGRNDTTNGTNGGVGRVWGASEFVTATASATVAGLVGTLHLVCIRA